MVNLKPADQVLFLQEGHFAQLGCFCGLRWFGLSWNAAEKSIVV